jgi:hypothetical protein
VAIGHNGHPIKTLQDLLRAHGHNVTVDGVFGPQTDAAVRELQKSKGLIASGTVDAQTWSKLIIPVQQGSDGDAVRGVQEEFQFRDPGVEVDGEYGPQTDAAVRAFQHALSLDIPSIAVDGFVGAMTWQALVSGMLHSEYSIFFSHKTHDEKVTNQIMKLLEQHSKGIKYFVSENIEKGTRWRQAIAKHLNRASFLILVFTDPHEDWGWCLYETGFFDALSQISPAKLRRIYCLHHASTSPPKPIEDLQTIPATKVRVEEWLKEVFQHTKQTGPDFSAIPGLAESICVLFKDVQKLVYSQGHVNVVVNREALISADDLPEDTSIEGDAKLMEELFGHSDRTDWRTAKNRLQQFPNSADVNSNTLKELSRAVYNISSKSPVHPLQGIIFVEEGPKRYRPVITRAKELDKVRIDCEIMFIEDVGGQLQNVDRALGALLTSIRSAVRIRWEIIRPFVSNVLTLATLDAHKLRFDLQTCFNNVFLEAEFRGSFSRIDIVNAFERSADKTRVLGIISEFDRVYPKIWQGIGFPGGRETFGRVSEQPMTDPDLLALEAGLRELERLNKDFLEMAVARAEVLIKRELSGNRRNRRRSS